MLRANSHSCGYTVRDHTRDRPLKDNRENVQTQGTRHDFVMGRSLTLARRDSELRTPISAPKRESAILEMRSPSTRLV
jgi:hypothetical protein